ncbi:MAG: sugar phosphate isomerase/epimerase [Acidimicrobiia bacterium]|nr:sugar phosphate isomerase/epimerase [Acidimicrobiia bacterium]
MAEVPRIGETGLGPAHLVLCHHSLLGVDFEDRVAAASAAGFDAVGLNLREYRRLRDEGRTDDELRRTLERHGQWLYEMEALGGWSSSGEERERSRRAEEDFFHMADAFGARYLQAVGPHEGSLDDAAEAFGALCDRAGEHGLVVGLEFLPFTNIPDVTTALRIVEGADRPNGGICADSWHFTRGTPDWEALERVPGDRVAGVQIDDGPLEPEDDDYLRDCLENRRPPGQGDFDLERFVSILDRIGSTAPIAVEVISVQLQERPAAETARILAESTRALLGAVRA